MAENTKIEWTDHSWNPWIGCQKVSPGCDNCYAEEWDCRFHAGAHWGPGAPRHRTANWNKPYIWDRKAKAEGRRQSVFPSMCDPFDNAVPREFHSSFWRVIAQTPNLNWLLLTKRPENVAKMLPPDWGSSSGWPYVWLGTSVEDRARLHRIDTLREIPAALRFLSLEPFLEDLGEIDLTGIGWVIIGGESGDHARPFDIAWGRSIIAQCKAAGVAVFMKQAGSNTVLNGISPRLPGEKKRHGKGGTPAEWPEDLRVREYPVGRVETRQSEAPC